LWLDKQGRIHVELAASDGDGEELNVKTTNGGENVETPEQLLGAP